MRQHPVHDAVAALTRQQKTTIHITPHVSYRVTAPCLLAQLAAELGVSSTTTGAGGGVARSKMLVAPEAWDLWQEIQHNTHSWAAALDIDRRPYLPTPAPQRPARDPVARPTPAPWWATIDPEAAAQLDPDRIPAPARPPAPRLVAVRPETEPDLPPIGRLLRLVTATATSKGLDEMADTIHRCAVRWTRQIEALLQGRVEQRGVRGATCPHCAADTVLDERDDGRYRIPAVVLVDREIAGERLQWLTCLACGWSRGLADLADLTTAGAAP